MDFEHELDAASPVEFNDDSLTRQVIGAAIAVHRVLGPGLLESAYQACLGHELAKRSLRVDREVPLPIVYDGVRLECGYRLDLVVNGAVIVEVKAVEKTTPIHEAQLLTYLRLSGISRGLIINFNVPALRLGITRRVWTRPPIPASMPSSAPSAPLR